MSLGRHLDEEQISAASDRERPGSASIARHLALCAFCRARLADAVALRSVVARAATVEIAPEHDLRARTFSELRRREETVATVNGTVDALVGIARAVMQFTFGRRA